MRDSAQIAYFHARKLERTRADGMEGLAGDAVDAAVGGDVVGGRLAVDLGCGHRGGKITGLGEFCAFEEGRGWWGPAY